MKNSPVSMQNLDKTFPAVSPVNFPKILEENVGNFCPYCGKTIFSNLLEINGKVYLEKNCCKHELFHLENDADFFLKHQRCLKVEPFFPNPKSQEEVLYNTPSHPLLRFDITTECNMKCPICYWRSSRFFKPGDRCVSLKEIRGALKKCKSREVLLFATEPTMVDNLFEIIKAIRDSGNIPGISTNGLKLEDKNYVKKLKKAGLKFIIFQFDGFNPKVYTKFRGKNYLEIKLKALNNIKEIMGSSFRVSLSSVIEKGFNENEIPKIIQFALQNTFFIDKVYFLGLRPPTNKNTAANCPAVHYSDTTNYSATAYSDLIKAMENYGYFDKEYFFEMVKMHKNIHEFVRKIFKGTPLENWSLARLPDSINIACYFKKQTNPPKLLFQKSKIREINDILVETMNKNNKSKVLLSLIKGSPKLLNSPLWRMAVARLSLLFGRPAKTCNSLEVFVYRPTNNDNRLLDGRRVEEWKSKLFLLSTGPLAHLWPEYPIL